MNLVDWAIDISTRLGGPGVGLLLLLENLFPPIPSEVVLPLAGVTVGLGRHPFLAMVFWSTLGSLLGAYVLYGVGRMIGPERIVWLCRVLPLIEEDDYRKSAAWFERHGSLGVFLGRMVPGVRSLISIPAGITGMGLVRFTLLTIAGSTIWNTAFITLGYLLGERWHLIEPYTDSASTVVLVLIGALMVWFIATRLYRNRRTR